MPGHLPKEMEVDREISEGWNKAICSASTASQRRRCSGVRGIVGGGVKGRVGNISLIVRVGKGGIGVGAVAWSSLSVAKGWMGIGGGGEWGVWFMGGLSMVGIDCRKADWVGGWYR